MNPKEITLLSNSVLRCQNTISLTIGCHNTISNAIRTDLRLASSLLLPRGRRSVKPTHCEFHLAVVVNRNSCRNFYCTQYIVCLSCSLYLSPADVSIMHLSMLIRRSFRAVALLTYKYFNHISVELCVQSNCTACMASCIVILCGKSSFTA